MIFTKQTYTWHVDDADDRMKLDKSLAGWRKSLLLSWLEVEGFHPL